MADKRYWYRWADGIEYIESAPVAVFDRWIESALLREGLVDSTEQFGDPDLKPPPHPVVRYEKFCGAVVTDWLKAMTDHPDVVRRRIPSNLSIPDKYPLSAFIATRYGSVWDVLPQLVRHWHSLTKPAHLIFDGLDLPHNQTSHQSQLLHQMLIRLAGATKNTACYGPVVVAKLE